jgi:hypothetical protein
MHAHWPGLAEVLVCPAHLACFAVKPEHLAAAVKQSPEAFAVSVCAAMRVLCAVPCSQASQQALAGADAADAAASLLSLLPAKMTTTLPPEALLASVNQVTIASITAFASSGLQFPTVSPAVEAAAAAAAVLAGSSSSREGARLGEKQHVPFVVSLMLTANKCAAALRGACPKLALDVASTVSRNRIKCTADVRRACLLAQTANMSTAQLRAMCSSLSSSELRARMQGLVSVGAAAMAARTDPLSQFLGSYDMLENISDSELQAWLQNMEAVELQTILTWCPADAADADKLPTGRQIGEYAPARIIAASPQVTFKPGAVITGNSAVNATHGSLFWYEEQLSSTMTPWLTVAARSMWLMGQVLSELLLASASSSSSVSRQTEQELLHRVSEQSANLTGYHMVTEEYFGALLEGAYVCVEWLASQLCHMQLPGDVAAVDRVSSSSSSPEDTASSMPLLTQLLQQHAQLQTGLYAAVQRCTAAGQLDKTQHDVKSAAAASLLRRVWGDQLPGQLRAFGAAVAAGLPVGWACNNAACTNLGKLSELQLVTGKAKVCSSCKQVRLCSAECQKQHWKAGHKLVCKKLAAAAAAEGECTAGSRCGNSAAAAAGGQDSGSSSSGTGSAASGAAAAAAGLELPSSAAAVAALSVRQLKALLTQLGVPGLPGAVEKSDLVGLLVGHLRLS